MEMKKHVKALTGLDISESFQIGFVQNQCPFHVRHFPASRYILPVGGYKTDRVHLNAHATASLIFRGSIKR
jgi:hypothetical protein